MVKKLKLVGRAIKAKNVGRAAEEVAANSGLYRNFRSSSQYYLRLFERKCVVVVLTICQGIGHNLANRWLPGMQEIADTAQFALRLVGSFAACRYTFK